MSRKGLSLAKGATKNSIEKNLAKIEIQNAPAIYKKGNGKIKNERIPKTLIKNQEKINEMEHPTKNLCVNFNEVKGLNKERVKQRKIHRCCLFHLLTILKHKIIVHK